MFDSLLDQLYVALHSGAVGVGVNALTTQFANASHAAAKAFQPDTFEQQFKQVCQTALSRFVELHPHDPDHAQAWLRDVLRDPAIPFWFWDQLSREQPITPEGFTQHCQHVFRERAGAMDTPHDDWFVELYVCFSRQLRETLPEYKALIILDRIEARLIAYHRLITKGFKDQQEQSEQIMASINNQTDIANQSDLIYARNMSIEMILTPLKRENSLQLIALPRMGKTFILKQIGYTLKQMDGINPVFIDDKK